MSVQTRISSDISERKYTFERVQDVEPILDDNNRLRSEPQKSDWGRHKARIPNVIYEKWFNEYNEGRSTPDLNIFSDDFNAYVNRKLNDPDWAFLRVDNKSNPFFMGYKK